MSLMLFCGLHKSRPTINRSTFLNSKPETSSKPRFLAGNSELTQAMLISPAIFSPHSFFSYQLSQSFQHPLKQTSQLRNPYFKSTPNSPHFPRRIPTSRTQYNDDCNDSNEFSDCSASSDADSSDTRLANRWWFNSDTLVTRMQSCCNVKERKMIHAVVLKVYGDTLMFVSNNLITSYLNHCMLIEARKVFDGMSKRNIVTWTAMLNGYVKFGLDDESVRLFNEFVCSGVGANGKTYVCVLNMCSRRIDYKLGSQIHACILKGNWSNLIVDSAVMYFYAQCSDLAGVFRIFDKMVKRDVICWTTAITACSQHGHSKMAFELFLKMLTDGFLPNEFTVCSVLKACGDEKVVKFGRQLHGGVVKKMFKDDVFIGTSLIDMYAKCEEILNSIKVFVGMRKRNTVTWTSIIAGHARNGLGEEAIGLFRVMKRRKIFVNNLTIVSILRACGAVRALSTGKEVHAQILKNSIENDAYIGCTLLWLYCRNGEYTYAFNVLQQMPLRDVVAWTTFISGCANIGHEMEALEYLQEMIGEGVVPNPFTYSSALKACTKLEDVLRGKLIHSYINKTDYLSNAIVGSALINMYAKCGYISEAALIFYSIPERNSVSSKAMILGYASNGLCREALQLLYRVQEEGVKVEDYIVTAVLTACGDVEWDTETSSEYHIQPS